MFQCSHQDLHFSPINLANFLNLPLDKSSVASTWNAKSQKNNFLEMCICRVYPPQNLYMKCLKSTHLDLKVKTYLLKHALLISQCYRVNDKVRLPCGQKKTTASTTTGQKLTKPFLLPFENAEQRKKRQLVLFRRCLVLWQQDVMLEHKKSSSHNSQVTSLWMDSWKLKRLELKKLCLGGVGAPKWFQELRFHPEALYQPLFQQKKKNGEVSF